MTTSTPPFCCARLPDLPLALPGRWNGREKGLMLRLSAPGSVCQPALCLAALRDKAKTNKLAALVDFKETAAYREFLNLPKEKLFAWNDDDSVYVAGKAATRALQLFLEQFLGFYHDEGTIFKVDCEGEVAQLAIMARLEKLTNKWGFELHAGEKPEFVES